MALQVRVCFPGTWQFSQKLRHESLNFTKVNRQFCSTPATMPIWAFFSSVPQKGDVILFDEYAHASIRDGLRMSLARSFKFRHNDLGHLRELLVKFQHFDTIYVVTESVFSMDGDSPDVQELLKIVREFQALLVVDEAHAIGVCGKDYKGLFQEESGAVFARIVTFGKAMGCHGAAILGSKILKDYLVNFARSFIYTTAMSPHSVATIAAAYGYFEEILDREPGELQQLRDNLQFFEEEIQKKRIVTAFHYFRVGDPELPGSGK